MKCEIRFLLKKKKKKNSEIFTKDAIILWDLLHVKFIGHFVNFMWFQLNRFTLV